MTASKRIIRIVIIICRHCAIVLAGITLCGCSLEDERDLCCERYNMMRYVYRPYGVDEFQGNIHTLRHLLYDQRGRYLREMPSGSDLQYQTLALPEGSYTMVTLGNFGDGQRLNLGDAPSLEELELSVASRFEDSDGVRGNCDEIFWGISNFDVDASGYITCHDYRRKYTDYTYPATEMNNIHCHLKVRVEWANMPLYFGDYILELSDVASHYSLDPGRSQDAGGFTGPPPGSPSVCRLRVPLWGDELEGEFVTLRYSDDHIPTLRIFHDDLQIGPDIDLRRAFAAWGWKPDEIHVQEYAIDIKLYNNGRAEVSPHFEGVISDWVNGGNFS